MSAHRDQAGFTLVELLVGLAIAGIVLLPLTDMLYTGAESARAVRGALDAQADARFALERIATRAAVATFTPLPPGVPPTPANTAAAWLSPLEFKLAGGTLLEIDNTKPVRTSTIAVNVASLQLETAATEPGWRPLLRITLALDPALAACGEHCVLTRTVRLGALP